MTSTIPYSWEMQLFSNQRVFFVCVCVFLPSCSTEKREVTQVCNDKTINYERIDIFSLI